MFRNIVCNLRSDIADCLQSLVSVCSGVCNLRLRLLSAPDDRQQSLPYFICHRDVCGFDLFAVLWYDETYLKIRHNAQQESDIKRKFIQYYNIRAGRVLLKLCKNYVNVRPL